MNQQDTIDIAEAPILRRFDGGLAIRVTENQNIITHQTIHVGPDDTYNVIFFHDGPITYCVISWGDKSPYAHRPRRMGHSICNPSDTYDRTLGEKIAMRRACAIGLGLIKNHHFTALYSAYRKNLFENGKAE